MHGYKGGARGLLRHVARLLREGEHSGRDPFDVYDEADSILDALRKR